MKKVTLWRLSINGGVIAPIAGAFLTAWGQDYWLGVAGWLLGIILFVDYERRGDPQ